MVKKARKIKKKSLFETRKSTLFEKILLVIGIAVLIFGFYFINKMFLLDGALGWDGLTASFLWLVLLFMVILTSSTQDIKEELYLVMKEEKEEVRLLKDISRKQLQEIKLLREDLNNKRKKR